MDPGKLSSLITLQQPATGQDEVGQPLDGWTDVVTVWADVRHPSGLEIVRANAEQGRVQASIRIRWRTDVHTGMRVLHGGRPYNIKAVLPGATRQFVDLVCEVAG
jgi:SPP1 family predicted phage head-tail adaptor